MPLTNIIDSSGNGLTGSLSSAVAYVSGKDLGGYQATGKASVNIAAAGSSSRFNIGYTGSFTLSLWWYPGATTNQLLLFDNASSSLPACRGINIYCNSALYFHIGNATANNGGGYVTSLANLSASKWNHIAVVYKYAAGTKNDWKIFFNNLSQSTADFYGGTISANPTYSHEPRLFGGRWTDASINPSAGDRIDMWAFWDTALSASDIANIYGSPSASYIASAYSGNLVALYGMDETDVLYGFSSGANAVGSSTQMGGDWRVPTFMASGSMRFTGSAGARWIGNDNYPAPVAVNVVSASASGSVLSLLFDGLVAGTGAVSGSNSGTGWYFQSVTGSGTNHVVASLYGTAAASGTGTASGSASSAYIFATTLNPLPVASMTCPLDGAPGTASWSVAWGTYSTASWACSSGTHGWRTGVNAIGVGRHYSSSLP